MIYRARINTTCTQLPGLFFCVVVFVPAGDGQRERANVAARIVTHIAAAQLLSRRA